MKKKKYDTCKNLCNFCLMNLPVNILGAVTRDTFTMVIDPFNVRNWRDACDRTFPR